MKGIPDQVRYDAFLSFRATTQNLIVGRIAKGQNSLKTFRTRRGLRVKHGVTIWVEALAGCSPSQPSPSRGRGKYRAAVRFVKHGVTIFFLRSEGRSGVQYIECRIKKNSMCYRIKSDGFSTFRTRRGLRLGGRSDDLFVTLNLIQSRIVGQTARVGIIKTFRTCRDSGSNLDYSGGRKTHRFPPPYGLGSLSLTIALPKIQPE